MIYQIFSIIFITYMVYLTLKNRGFFEKKIEPKNVTSVYDNSANESYSLEERFIWSIGDLEHEALAHNIEEFDFHKYLKEHWGLTFKLGKEKEQVIFLLKELWKEGSLSKLLNTAQFWKEVKVRDMIAFDSARFTELIRQALYLNYISEEEAWGWLVLNAQRVQESYENWNDFSNAYFKGATLFYDFNEESKVSFDFKKVLSERMEVSVVEPLWLDESLFKKIKLNKE